MKTISVSVESLSKAFNRRIIFDNITFSLRERQSVAVTGKNGSGKSTLAKILCGLLSPSRGQIRCSIDGEAILTEGIYQHVGLVSPYITMYEEFSGIENLVVFAHIRGLRGNIIEDSENLLKRFGIYARRNDEVRTYSSGMKQRLKYAAALLHRPEILVLDEPTANLDEEGVGVVRSTMRSQIENGILIIATNDKEDLDYAQSRIDLDSDGSKKSSLDSR
ncbi:MAG: ABC transporter ATP-binding protein [Bacteroidota bacterium]